MGELAVVVEYLFSLRDRLDASHFQVVLIAAQAGIIPCCVGVLGSYPSVLIGTAEESNDVHALAQGSVEGATHSMRTEGSVQAIPGRAMGFKDIEPTNISARGIIDSIVFSSSSSSEKAPNDLDALLTATEEDITYSVSGN